MADNVTLNAGSGGATIAADDISSVWYQRVKVCWGLDGTATDTSASNPIPVVQTGTLTVQPGNTANTTAWLVTGTGGTFPVTDSGGTLTVDAPVGTPVFVRLSDGTSAITTLPVSLASVPSHAVTNAGTFAVQETGAGAVVGNGTAATAQRVTLASDSTGIVALTTSTASIGKLAANSGVDIGDVDITSVIPGTGATNLGKAEDAAHASGDTGVMMLAVQQTADAALAGTTGDYAPLQVDSNGYLKVNIKAGAGSGGTALADNAAYTPGVTSFTPIGGEVDDTGTTAATENSAAACRMTVQRALHVNLRDAAGAELSVGGGTQYTEDAAAAADPVGNAINLIRNDSRTGSLTSADGDNIAVRGTNFGEMYVKHVDAIPVTDNSGSLTVDGTVAATQSGTWNITNVSGTVSLPTGAATAAKQPALGTAGTASADVITVQGIASMTALKVDGSAVTQPVSDAGGSLTVDNGGTFAVQAASAGDVASDGVDSGNPVKIGFQARTSDITAVASADRVNGIADILGKQVVLLNAVPDLTWSYAAAAGGLVTTSGVTAKAAAGAGIRNYVDSIQVINSHQTISTEVVIRDGASGTVLHRGWAQAAGGGYAMRFDPPLRGTANTLVEIAEVTTTATAGVLVNLQGHTAAN